MKGMNGMKIVITNIDFDHVDVVCMSDDKRCLIDTDNVSAAIVHFDVFKKGNKLSGITKVPFEQYMKMNHEELTGYIESCIK